jgi:hypothetical protein
VSNQEKSPTESSTHSDAQIQEAEDNLTGCLEAYDQNGESGLEAELEQIHPNPALKSAGLRGGWIHGLVSDESHLKTRKATSSEME